MEGYSCFYQASFGHRSDPQSEHHIYLSFETPYQDWHEAFGNYMKGSEVGRSDQIAGGFETIYAIINRRTKDIDDRSRNEPAEVLDSQSYDEFIAALHNEYSKDPELNVVYFVEK
ncbi:hypothetical protein AOL_s00091g36 [Orbilia oligospora ATCC 24927]|uniref:Uncharacterized protein n=1 Tax=Arthrobotrys oligospora (strain ATCC 24927 / CBS 115.81 / DSM 1491) TaxID=756982 RepID=G1XHY4_ARTOA|nr:hypothetical protein AOL_s00091g36 [Orbilia oligospora ATCC 24927]EGX47215.1 hypothetical protein AOL_s00091g36 [Orbilia oligospora ATCC 24927]